jgi:hypothetical protein
MRNLLQYPVTEQEMAVAARRAATDYNAAIEALPVIERPIGGIHGTALTILANNLEENLAKGATDLISLDARLVEVTAQRDAMALEIASLNEALEASKTKADTASALLERDRTAVCDGVEAIRKAIASRQHLSEPGRGSFAWDDEGYQAEFGAALSEIQTSLAPLSKVAKDWEACPTDAGVIQAARSVATQSGDVLLTQVRRAFTYLANARPVQAKGACNMAAKILGDSLESYFQSDATFTFVGQLQSALMYGHPTDKEAADYCYQFELALEQAMTAFQEKRRVQMAAPTSPAA